MGMRPPSRYMERAMLERQDVRVVRMARLERGAPVRISRDVTVSGTRQWIIWSAVRLDGRRCGGLVCKVWKVGW